MKNYFQRFYIKTQMLCGIVLGYILHPVLRPLIDIITKIVRIVFGF